MSTATIDLIKQVAKRKTSSAKDETPAVSLPDLAPQIRQFTEWARQIKDLEAQRAALKADLLAAIEPHRIALARSKGEYIGSIRVNGLLYVTQNNGQKNWSEDEVSAARAAFGDQFETYFKDTYSVSVDVTALPPDLFAALIAAGAVIEQKTTTTKQLHIDRTLRPEIQQMADAVPAASPTCYFKE